MPISNLVGWHIYSIFSRLPITFLLSAESESRMYRPVLILCLLSMAAGAVDIIGFLGLGGLFAAHITGNLVILAAHFVTGKYSAISSLLAVPVFMLVLWFVTLLIGKIEKSSQSILLPLFLCETVLLSGTFILATFTPPSIDYNHLSFVLTGMLAVSAMAIQSALVKFVIKGAPSTVAMTSNITQLTLDLAELAGFHHSSKESEDILKDRTTHLLCCIGGFIVGCGLGAVLQANFGLKAFALPFVLLIIVCVFYPE